MIFCAFADMYYFILTVFKKLSDFLVIRFCIQKFRFYLRNLSFVQITYLYFFSLLFKVSPVDDLVAFHGRFGDIHLLSSKSRSKIFSLKMNDKVEAVSFRLVTELSNKTAFCNRFELLRHRIFEFWTIF